MKRSRPVAVRDIPVELRQGITCTLTDLGFASLAARNTVSRHDGALGVIVYDTYRHASREPYLAVVVRGQGMAAPLFPDAPKLGTACPHVAYTDGSIWTWYSCNSNVLQPMNCPPPPPALPPGGRWLEPVEDKRAFKHLLRAMNVAQRDSCGGSIVERFDVISKVLFAKVCDEWEVEQEAKDVFEFQILPGDTSDSVYARITDVWSRACLRHRHLYHGDVPTLTQDQAALYRIVELLQDVSLRRTPVDTKGLAYEELLHNTFEKNENQQFFTPRELVQFVVSMTQPCDQERICDPACGTAGFLVEASRATGHKAIVVGADVDARLTQVAQMNLIMHGTEHAAVHYLPGMGSLAPLDDIAAFLKPGSFDLILTNPPFGSDLSDDAALAAFETGRGRTSRRRSVLFTERCLSLLKPGGRMAIVLDDSVLNLPSNADVRSLIRSQAVIEAVVSLPDVAFMPYSTAKCSILFLRRKIGAEAQGQVFMAEASEVGRRPNGDPLYADDRDSDGNRILLSDLPDITSEYMRFRNTGSVSSSSCFITAASRLDDRLDIAYYHPRRFAAEQELNRSRWPTPAVGDLVIARGETINPAEELGDSPIRWLGLGDIEEGTGQYEVKVVPGDKIRSSGHVFKGGDILFSRLRPNLRKAVLIPDDDEGGVCSGEIIVLRGLDKLSQDYPRRIQRWPDLGVDSEYLVLMLRSDLVYGQLMYKVTGVGRPRVSVDTILTVRIPLPPLEEQRRLVSVLKAAQEAARAARHEASVWLVRAAEVINEAYERVIDDLTTPAEVAL